MGDKGLFFYTPNTGCWQRPLHHPPKQIYGQRAEYGGNNHEKEYFVTVKQPNTKTFIYKMSNGVPILGTLTKKCFVEQIDKFTFRIILTQGLNRQIRRMCEYLGNEVLQLERYRIMNIHLDIPVGKWRNLTKKELNEIFKLVSESSKTI